MMRRLSFSVKKFLTPLLILAVLLTGCIGAVGFVPIAAEAAEDISGDYYAFSCSDEDGEQLALDGEILHLNPDGTGTFEIFGEQYGLEWQYKSRTHDLTFVDEFGDTFEGTYHSNIIAGTYFDGLYYMFTSDKRFYESLVQGRTDVSSGMGNTGYSPSVSSGNSGSASTSSSGNSGAAAGSSKPAAAGDGTGGYYRMRTLYEPTYGIKTANVLVPEDWTASVSVDWGLCSSMYPAIAFITIESPDNDAKIEISSPFAYLQMAYKGSWVPEGTYIDLYNVFLNYRNAHDYNNYLLGTLGYKGTILNTQGPDRATQRALDQEAHTLLSVLSSTTGISAISSEGSSEKTTYFITSGDAYEVDISSAVVMAHTGNWQFEQYQWIVPYCAAFTAYTEEAYSKYAGIFDNVVSNSSFSNEFTYVVQRNAHYINEMINQYLMDRVYAPSSGDIRSWDREYTETEQDKWVNEWCDVIKEQDEYMTTDGNALKVPTKYDAVYQNKDMIYMGPEADLGVDWTQLNKN